MSAAPLPRIATAGTAVLEAPAYVSQLGRWPNEVERLAGEMRGRLDELDDRLARGHYPTIRSEAWRIRQLAAELYRAAEVLDAVIHEHL